MAVHAPLNIRHQASGINHVVHVTITISISIEHPPIQKKKKKKQQPWPWLIADGSPLPLNYISIVIDWARDW
jgi:hypothetical protein